jgi:hypothetical protein
LGFKMKYNCYILPIQALKKIIWSWWGDMGVRTWNFENYQKTQLIKGTVKIFLDHNTLILNLIDIVVCVVFALYSRTST